MYPPPPDAVVYTAAVWHQHKIARYLAMAGIRARDLAAPAKFKFTVAPQNPKTP